MGISAYLEMPRLRDAILLSSFAKLTGTTLRAEVLPAHNPAEFLIVRDTDEIISGLGVRPQ